MKKILLICIGVCFTASQFVLQSCKKEEKITSVTDIEGNVYQVVKIGEQYWMAENLKVTKLNDGTAIPLATDNSVWGSATTPVYCWYDNNIANKDVYGALYNFHCVSTGKLCPTGWHVPTESEWNILQAELGGELVAGGKMKETGTTYWNSPNTGATNESGFNARGSGVRFLAGVFGDLKNVALWWTSTEGGPGAWFRSVHNQNTNLNSQGYNKKNGLSVRCIKD